ncbi:protease (I) and scaffold (Z) protein [Azoarcus olearius]|uniref:phage protease n=1 Tax=Azoarcus sp. (strain BH72) TaxID=418699 RepID=UPI0008062A0E|nr:phage protease [Azoarcus olearius]ANQ83699.1 protease (I) and scaffold (Z) protein [Azoarcus olearius]
MATQTRTALPSLAACALRVKAGEPLSRLIPAGEFDAPRGALTGSGPWRLTPQGAARIIAANASRGTDIAIDYEHQLLLTEQNGQPAPAAGWIDPRSLVFQEGGDEPGLYGAIRWTAKAGAMIASDEYRYLSPVFPYDPATGEVLGLAHVALTNIPAIDEPVMAALSARLSAFPHHQENPDVNETLKKLLAALGLPDTTSEADAIAGVAALKVRADEANTQIAALKSAAPDPAKYVPVATMQALQTEVAALSARVNGDEAARLIEDAIAQGKLVEAQREWASALGKSDIAALRSYVSTAPAIAALKGMQSGGGNPSAGGGGPSDADLAVCKVLGLTAEEFNKAKIGG